MDGNEFLQHDISLRASVWPRRPGELFETHIRKTSAETHRGQHTHRRRKARREDQRIATAPEGLACCFHPISKANAS
jgi:hypothetical protein